jgi:DNA invertase Pin-like site-specific DNA recombinase
MPQADLYIRVSRVGGRAGENFIAPDVQRERARSFAEQQGIEIIAEHEELDVSGAKLQRPKLDLVLRRIQARETDGILVADRSRFARSLIGALEAIQKIEAVGGTFWAADGFDSSTPEGKLAINILLSFAEWELDRIRANWKAAVTRSIARGVHVSAVPPLGYQRERGQPLTVDSEAADKVKQAFVIRANGASWRKVADLLGTSVTGAADVIRNRAYLGEARGQYGLTNPTAHPALVDDDLWQRAQPGDRAKPKTPPTNVGILRSLVRCDGCEFRMAISGGRYVCFAHTSSKGKCPAPAAIAIAKLDQYVEGAIQDAMVDPKHPGHAAVAAALMGTEARDLAKVELDAARAELEAFVTEASVADAALFNLGVKTREARVATARRDLADVPAPEDWFAGDTTLSTWQEFDLLDRRAETARFIERVIVTKADPARKRWQPAAERAEIRWRA